MNELYQYAGAYLVVWIWFYYSFEYYHYRIKYFVFQKEEILVEGELYADTQSNGK